MRVACLPAICVLWAASLTAQADLNCRAIDDDAARLACYDQQFPRPPAKPEPEPEPEPEPRQAAVTDNAPAAMPAGADKPAEPSRPAQSADAITATVTTLSKPKGRPAVITLSNGQVWSQVSFRYARLREGDTVNIEPSRFGGYILANERGVKMRVRRTR